MRGLTLTQPWASLVAIGAKTFETRSWFTGYRGVVAIHAAATYASIGGKRNYIEICTSNEYIYRALYEAGLVPYTWNAEALLALPRGEILTLVDLTDCKATRGQRNEFNNGPKYADWVHELSAQERALGNFMIGRYGWPLANNRPLARPVPCRGAFGLWAIPIDVQTEISRQLAPPLA
jgi:activating signal cointegrator 1